MCHGEQDGIRRLPADVIALQGGGGGQHDVGVPRLGVPPGLMDDDRFGALPCLHQPVEILVVMKRVAAAPVDETDVGILQALPVVVERFPGVQKHVRDPGHRNEVLYGVGALRQGHPADGPHGIADGAGGAVAVADAAAGKSDLAQHRGENRRHPVRLFTMVGALQRPAHRNESPPRCHPSSQVANGGRGNAAYRRRPFRVLGLTVPLAREVAAEGFRPGAVFVEECLVVEALMDQRMCQTQHQSGVGIGVRRQPFGFKEIRSVVPYRADIHELDAVSLAALEPAAHRVLAQTACADLGILERESPETDHQLRVPGDHRPRRGFVADVRPVVAKDMGDDDLPRGIAVGIHRPDVAAELVQKPVQLALGMVETARGSPAVGAAEYSRVPDRVAYAPQLPGDKVERFVPTHGDERLGPAASTVVPGSPLQPTLAHHRVRHTAGVVHDVRNRPPNGRWIRVFSERPHGHDALVVDLDLVGAPVEGRLNVPGIRAPHSS